MVVDTDTKENTDLREKLVMLVNILNPEASVLRCSVQGFENDFK